MLSGHDSLVFFLQLALLLAFGRGLGEAARRLKQPPVVGEMLAGILLGPTILGRIEPTLFAWLFPPSGPTTAYRSAVTLVALVLFLLVAGMEMDLSAVFRQGRTSLAVSVSGIVAPFAAGFLLGATLPDTWIPDPTRRWTFALFLGTAMSISALPVIARTLLDLDLLRTELGSLVMAAAMVDDLAGWFVFSILLGLIQGTTVGAGSLVARLGTAIGLVVFCLTIGRRIVDRILPWIQTRLPWPGGILSLTMASAFAGAAVSEALGVHGVFGAFIVGVMIGDSAALREQARETIHQFVLNVFSPLFFATVGLRIDFLADFDPGLILVLVLLAFACKIGGILVAGKWAGMPKREAWAIGFALNSRGAMMIVFAEIARASGLVDDRFLVALVVVALATSLASGPMIQRSLGRPRRGSIADLVGRAVFVPRLGGRTKEEVIRELAEALAPTARAGAAEIAEAALEREAQGTTAVGGGLALPHGHLRGTEGWRLAIGRAPEGVDFDSPDGEPVRLVCLFVTPEEDPAGHIQALAVLARALHDLPTREALLRAQDAPRALATLEKAIRDKPGSVR